MKDIDKLKDLAKYLDEQIKKLEGEKPKEVNSIDDAIEILEIQNEDGTVFDSIEVDVDKFRARLTIAKALGIRPFVLGKINWNVCYTSGEWITMIMEYSKDEATNYFPTKKQAEKYLAVCLKENLL
jgi:hypothetical protein